MVVSSSMQAKKGKAKVEVNELFGKGKRKKQGKLELAHKFHQQRARRAPLRSAASHNELP